MRLDGFGLGPFGFQAAKRGLTDPHNGVHHDHPVGEVLRAARLQHDLESGDPALLIVVAGQLADLVLNLLGGASVSHEIIARLDLVRPG